MCGGEEAGTCGGETRAWGKKMKYRGGLERNGDEGASCRGETRVWGKKKHKYRGRMCVGG